MWDGIYTIYFLTVVCPVTSNQNLDAHKYIKKEQSIQIHFDISLKMTFINHVDMEKGGGLPKVHIIKNKYVNRYHKVVPVCKAVSWTKPKTWAKVDGFDKKSLVYFGANKVFIDNIQKSTLKFKISWMHCKLSHQLLLNTSALVKCDSKRRYLSGKIWYHQHPESSWYFHKAHFKY